MSVASPAIRPASRSPRVAHSHRINGVSPSSLPIRVVVGDHEPLSQAGITHVLQMAGLEVVAVASNVEDLARKTRAYRPDVAVVDIDMQPNLSDDERVQAARNIRSIDPSVAVLIMSRSLGDRHVPSILGDRPEGFGYLPKARIGHIEEFAASVRQVARGGTAIDPLVVSRLAGYQQTHNEIDDLTAREREVLALMAAGRSNGYIADELVVSKPAVERHITSIFAKLGLWANAADHRRVLAALRYLSY